jgi:hypothetical protein
MVQPKDESMGIIATDDHWYITIHFVIIILVFGMQRLIIHISLYIARYKSTMIEYENKAYVFGGEAGSYPVHSLMLYHVWCGVQ